uniref:arrestin domain-containing protein 1-like isoform X2 n=1 Tax=Myxine glutinosa TaxID=7769 RepID=UPI00358E9B65
MSGAEGLSLVFFGDDQVYRVGETVSGAVQFRLSGAPNFKAVEVDFHGDCVVTLPQSDNHKSRASEQYLKHTIILWKQEVCPPLSNGDQTFQFHFTLPVNIPSSFEGKYGKVCYRAKAVLRTSWYRLNITCKKKFSILNPVNMNDLPNIDMPLTISKEKKVFYDVFHRGLVSLRVTLNQGGFVPGEQMYITINVSNDCNCELKGTVCTLRQKTTFRTSFERDENKIIEEVAGGHVGPKQQGQWQLMIVVPQIPVSNLQFCKLIDVIYFLKHNFQNLLNTPTPMCKYSSRVLQDKYPVHRFTFRVRRRQPLVKWHHHMKMSVHRIWSLTTNDTCPVYSNIRDSNNLQLSTHVTAATYNHLHT